MAVLAVVTSSPAGVEGGHLVIARSLVVAARASGHDAHLVVTPDYGFGRTSKTYWASWTTDVRTIKGQTVDQVVSLRYPSFAVRHPAHVCWLNHTMREYYDLWPRMVAAIPRGAVAKELVRRFAMHRADRWLLSHNVTEVVAQSPTIAERVKNDFGLRAEVLLPPPPPRPYRCEAYEDYILAVSRLTPLKRLDLLIRSLAEPQAAQVRVVIVGDGESAQGLNALAAQLDVSQRVNFVGQLDDEALADQLARCRAVCFPPFHEDYGFVTAEAFASRKAVVTCSDSGGPADLVHDGESGIICEPTPASLAGALARLMDDRPLAERMGAAAAAQATVMTWPAAVKQLVIV